MPPKIQRQDIFLAIAMGIIGSIVGFGIGNYGGFPGEKWSWMALMGISGFYLTLAHKRSPRKKSIVILFYALQIVLFTAIGALITWAKIDPFGLTFGLRYGVLLSMMLGMFAEEIPYEIPGGFFLLLGVFAGGGAGAGGLLGYLFGFNAGLCAVFGLLMACLFPYYFMLLRSRLVFFTFMILVTLGLQVGFFLRWDLLLCFYVAAAISLGIGLIFSTLDYISVYGLKRSPVFDTLHLKYDNG